MRVADCEQFPDIGRAFGVEGYPTIILLKPQKTPEGISFAPVRTERGAARGLEGGGTQAASAGLAAVC